LNLFWCIKGGDLLVCFSGIDSRFYICKEEDS
jgi:hypothetical protein